MIGAKFTQNTLPIFTYFYGKYVDNSRMDLEIGASVFGTGMKSSEPIEKVADHKFMSPKDVLKKIQKTINTLLEQSALRMLNRR